MNESSRPVVEGPISGTVRQSDLTPPVTRAQPMSVLQRMLEYVRLVGRLMIDGRVSVFDRLLVVAAIAYVISPLDFIPDVLPVIGEIDDALILITALTRLFEHAGRHVVLSHWRGAPGDLHAGWLKKLAFVFSFFFPKASRRRLRRFSKADATP